VGLDSDALRYLARYRDKVSCYNDDIQGTGSITVAGLLNAMKIKKENLKDQRVLFLGAGSAGIGICGHDRVRNETRGIVGAASSGQHLAL
jgi:malic enzyme